jgi:YggT family protein
MNLFLSVTAASLAAFLKFYMIMLTLRIYLSWFPNINFYTQPWSTLGKMTDPYLRAFRGQIPQIGGLDTSVIVAFTVMSFLIDFFTSMTTAFGYYF